MIYLRVIGEKIWDGVCSLIGSALSNRYGVKVLLQRRDEDRQRRAARRAGRVVSAEYEYWMWNRLHGLVQLGRPGLCHYC
jgi:hypothetical protein